MKRLLLFVLVMMTCAAGAEMISDGSGFDPGALRKSRFRYYGGATEEPGYTVVSGHVISVDACCVNLWDNANFEGYPVNYTFAATEVTLNNNTTNYVVADYNGGTPIIKVITNVELITESDVVPILTIYDAGGFFHVLNWDELGVGLPNKLHQRLVKTQRYQRESGLSTYLLQPGVNLTFGITEGKVWYGAKRQAVDAINSTIDLVFLVAPAGTVTPITALNNTHYYNGGVYSELTPNRYAINWIYRGIEEQKHCYVMIGDGDYNLAQAQDAQPPSAPAIITSHAQLIAKVIVQKSSNTVYSLQSAFDVTFSAAGITNHNDLIGLNDGDYQHLTAAELAEVQAMDTNYVATSALTLILADYVLSSSLGTMAYEDITDYVATSALTLTLADYVLSSSLGTMAAEDTTDYVATSSLVTILLGYAALNGNIAEDFAIDHLSGVTASFTGDVDIAGDLTVGSAVDMTIVGDGAGNVTIDTVATLTFAGDTDFNGVVDLTDATVLGLPESVATHNNLLGLNDGDYQHLTAAELAEVQAMDTNYVSTSTYDADIGSLSEILEAILGVSSATMQYFGFDYDTGMLMGYNIAGGVNVTVPAAIDGVDVVAIANRFVSSSNITSIDMAAAPITSIGNSAFRDCNYLTSATLPSTLITIGDSAFYGSGLLSITVPSSVTTIGEDAFRGCNYLTSVTLPSSVTTIGKSAFYGSGLLSITVPSSVTTMDINVFRSCDNLAAAAINANITTLPAYTFMDCVALTDVTISSTITEIGTGAFDGCTTLTDTSFAAIIANITAINHSAFVDCDALTTVDVSGVTTFGTYVYNYNGVFSNCDALATITVNDSIVKYMFYGCPITKITIGAGASIYDDAAVGTNGTGFSAAYGTGGAGTYNFIGNNWVKE